MQDDTSMPQPIGPSTPWTVRTSKRKARAREPQPKKRQRLSSHNGHGPRTVPEFGQQTLTQIQFPPLSQSLPKYDEMEPVAAGADLRRNIMPKKSDEPKGPREPQAQKGLKKRKDTLTQMDFLAMKRLEDDRDTNGLAMDTLTPDAFWKGNLMAEKENVEPHTGRKGARAKRKSAHPSEGASSNTKVKKRKTPGCLTADDQDWHDSTPTPINGGGADRKALSEQKRGRNGTNAVVYSTPRKRRATVKADAEHLQITGPIFSENKEKIGPLLRSPPLVVPETPKRVRDVIPSSQSPESVSLSTRKRPLHHEGSPGSPLKDRSPDIPAITWSGRTRMSASDPARRVSSPKRRICVLKYGPGLFRKPELPLTHAATLRRRKSPQRPQCRGYLAEHSIGNEVDELGDDSNALDRAENPPDIEIPETSQIVQHKVIPSSQTDSGEEVEIPETSQGLRRNTSTPSLNRSEESLQLLDDHNALSTAKETHKEERVGQLEPGSLDADVPLQKFGSVYSDQERTLSQAAPTIQQSVLDATVAAPRLPAPMTRKQTVVSTIDDSQDEDDEEEDISYGLGVSRANDLELTKDLTRRDPNPPAETPEEQSPIRNTASSPTLPPVPRHTSYPPITITLVPTKLPPLSSSSSQTPFPPPPPPPRTMTQQSIHPASMTRPSQVSTQAPTQQSWLPMSSPPLPNTSLSSSPNHHHNATHATIKGSSSIAMPLGDIPSESQLQADAGFAMVDLGLGNGGSDDGQDRDEDLDPRSSSPLQSAHHTEIDEDARDDYNSSSNSNNNNIVLVNDAIREATSNPHRPAMLADPSKSKEEDGKQRLLGPNPPPASAPASPRFPHAKSRPNDNKHEQIPDPPPQHHHQQHRPPKPPATLQLSESLLESLPGPPGWMAPPSWQAQSQSQSQSKSQAGPGGDWDERML